MLSKSDRCQELSSPGITNFIVSCFILMGILISYIPQHYRIIKRRSSEGLSPYFVLLGTTSGTCAIANILVLPTSREDLTCCTVNSAFSCAAGLLGVAQIGVQWSCFFLIMMLFLAFTPRHGIDRRDGAEIPLEPTDAGLRDAVIVVLSCVVHFVITLIVSVIILARYPGTLGTWANILGILCAGLACIQYIPQIWTTWRLQHIGSLSIPMMCIQTPGSFLFAASLASRFGSRGWSTWAVYIITGSLQGCLLAMAVRFEWRDRRERRKGPWEASEADNEGVRPGSDTDFDAEGAPLLSDQVASDSRRIHYPDPHNHPLAPHRLNPDPDSPPTSAASSMADSPARTPHNRSRKGSRWFSSIRRSG